MRRTRKRTALVLALWILCMTVPMLAHARLFYYKEDNGGQSTCIICKVDYFGTLCVTYPCAKHEIRVEDTR